jgi:hypothetical protein
MTKSLLLNRPNIREGYMPITSPVNEDHCLGKNVIGNTIAGCEKVNGIVICLFVYLFKCRPLQ